MARPKILVLSEYYLPACKAGGALRTIVNTVEILGGEFEFLILTRDRDLLDEKPYPDVSRGCWQDIGLGKVYYIPSENTAAEVERLIRETPHDLLMMNSFFSPTFTIKPLWLRRRGRIPRRATVVCPRGELADSALAIKSLKKKLYLKLARIFGLWRGVEFLASSEIERADIIEALDKNCSVAVCPDPVMLPSPEVAAQRPQKQSGRCRLLFLSRICPVKNLLGALSILKKVQPGSGEIVFDIFGPIEDDAYWAKCKEEMNSLPEGVRAEYHGLARSEEVFEIMSRYDLLFLPTHGENFGHVIIEALLVGCPVLISDQTSWNGLEECGAGWAFPLGREDMFRRSIEKVQAMDEAQRCHAAHAAIDYAAAVVKRNDPAGLLQAVFLEILKVSD